MGFPGYQGNAKLCLAIPRIWKAEGSAVLQPHLAPGGSTGSSGAQWQCLMHVPLPAVADFPHCNSQCMTDEPSLVSN